MIFKKYYPNPDLAESYPTAPWGYAQLIPDDGFYVSADMGELSIGLIDQVTGVTVHILWVDDLSQEMTDEQRVRRLELLFEAISDAYEEDVEVFNISLAVARVNYDLEAK